MTKPVFMVFDQGRHKPGCTTTEYSQRVEYSDIRSKGVVLCSKIKDTDQLHVYRAADLRLCFCIK